LKLSLLSLALVLGMAAPMAAQEPPPLPAVNGERVGITVTETEDGMSRIVGSDNFPSPKAEEKAEKRRAAVHEQIAKGMKGQKVHRVANGQYVDFPVDRTDRVFVMLVEFGTQGGYIASPSNPGLSQAPGPLHNQIPQPNRDVNNFTIWQPDYNRDHYVDMYFNKMKEYYRAQSSGRYTFNGEVMHWVTVPFNGSRYGSNALGDASMWTLIADTINVWTAQQIASGKTLQEVTEYLKTYDVADRYDYNGNGNFDEPDGYIDHFQIVHAGAGEETGGGTLGADAIWSHRWFAFNILNGKYASVQYAQVGPAFNQIGGVEFGGGWGANPTGTTLGSGGGHVTGLTYPEAQLATSPNAHNVTPTGIWVGDYTVQPENGGLGVFAHEYGHDLGLPDHYDTAGGTNGTGYWTIMSSGSYLGDGGEDVGSRPGDMSAWDKLQLGWLIHDIAELGKFSTHKLGPAEFSTKKAQAVVIPLPDDQNFTFEYDVRVDAAANGKVWYSGSANEYEASMTRSIDVPATNATLTMRLAYNIETNWDYAFVSVSNNGGTSWTNLAATGITTNTNPNGNNPNGNGITGNSAGAWRNASFNLSAFAGQTVLLRIRYSTDEYTFNWGVVVDDIKIGDFTDTADSTTDWELDDFASRANGKRITNNPHFYIAEFKQYKGYDTGLQTGPYAGTGYLSGKVGHYPYQDGLLITYADSDRTRNNTSVHPGEGFALPIDAHPVLMNRLGVQEPGTDRFWNFSSPWTNTIQVFDATFSLEPTDAITLPFIGNLPPLPGSPAGSPNRRVQFDVPIASKPGNSFFSDLNAYWFLERPDSSVIIPQTGASIRIINTSAHDSFMQIHVNGK
jgi:immune inhibitor A